MKFNVSIVLYKTNIEEINRSIAFYESSGANKIYLVDNDKDSNYGYDVFSNVEYIKPGSNLGYGAGHNIAIKQSINDEADLHLVANTDIEMSFSSLKKILDICEQDSAVGLAGPKIVNRNNETQFAAKLVPSPLDLLIRLLFGQHIHMKIRPSFYLENMDRSQCNSLLCPYISGCFMLLRVATLKEVGAFDERFFMYPEDLDISRRIAISQNWKSVFVTDIHLFHQHNAESKRSLKMLYIHIINMIKYFNKWGWIVDIERKVLNQEAARKSAHEKH